jgi:hypothetical protein
MKFNLNQMLSLVIGIGCGSPLAMAKPSTTPKQATAPVLSSMRTTEALSPATPTAYDFGAEFTKQLLGSIRPDRFSLVFNVDVVIPNNGNSDPQINDLKIKTVMQFKDSKSGIVVPLLAPDQKANAQQKSLETYVHLGLGSKYAILKLNKGEKNNEFSGRLEFYSLSSNGKKLVPDEIVLAAKSDALTLVKIYLIGANIKVTLPSAGNGNNLNEKALKKDLFQVLVNCESKVEIVDPLNWSSSAEDAPACQFTLDDDQIRLKYNMVPDSKL